MGDGKWQCLPHRVVGAGLSIMETSEAKEK